MTKIPNANARDRVAQIADCGYTILSDTASGSLKLLESNHADTPLTLENLAKWAEAGDSGMAWMNENLGAMPLGDLEAGPLQEACQKAGTTTLVSDLFEGARLSLILSHAKDELDEMDIKEVRAAALILQTDNPNDAKYEITAKELIYLEQVATGATDDEIAAELQLSLRAVKERKRKAIDDLFANNIGHAVGIAKRAKLI